MFTRQNFILFLTALLLSNINLLAQGRDSWQQPKRIMDSLNIKPGMIIGEVGAGSGYFTFKLADRLNGKGFLYANDIDKSGFERIVKYCNENKINNVKTIVGEDDDPRFPVDTLDLVIMVYVFHHLDDHVTFLKNTERYLKSGGPIIIVERDPDRFGNDSHFMRKEEILEQIDRAGFFVIKLYTFLPRDNIYVCYPINTH